MKSNKSFKGSINRIKLYSEMMNWKHSLCVPIDKGWATAKYLEYLKCGISPLCTQNMMTRRIQMFKISIELVQLRSLKIRLQ